MSPKAKTTRKANSSRSGGAVGNNPVVYRVFREMFGKDLASVLRVLDFGAGKKPVHAQALRREGYNIDAFDLPENMGDEYNKSAMSQMYDVVLLSNVLNVQSSQAEMEEILGAICSALSSGAHFLANFPASPRYSEFDNAKMTSVLKKFFQIVLPHKGKTTGKQPVVFYATNAYRR